MLSRRVKESSVLEAPKVSEATGFAATKIGVVNQLLFLIHHHLLHSIRDSIDET